MCPDCWKVSVALIQLLSCSGRVPASAVVDFDDFDQRTRARNSQGEMKEEAQLTFSALWK
jgi:hypothetical protein